MCIANLLSTAARTGVASVLVQRGVATLKNFKVGRTCACEQGRAATCGTPSHLSLCCGAKVA